MKVGIGWDYIHVGNIVKTHLLYVYSPALDNYVCFAAGAVPDSKFTVGCWGRSSHMGREDSQAHNVGSQRRSGQTILVPAFVKRGL